MVLTNRFYNKYFKKFPDLTKQVKIKFEKL